MSGWNEDNFLERLMPPPGRRLDAGPCPEAEAFCAVSGGETGETLKNAVAAHTARCPACSDLQRRLQAFDNPLLTGQETEWGQTEDRLANWLESFLTSGAAVDLAGRRTKASHPRLWWKRLASPPSAWQMRWVLVLAAASAVAVCSFLAGRLSAPRPRQLTAAASYSSSSPNPIPAGTVANGRIPEKRPDRESQLSQAAPQTQPNPAGGAPTPSSAPLRISPSPVIPAAPREIARATDTALLPPPAPNSGKTPASSPLEPRPSGTAPSVGPAGPGVLSSRRAPPSVVRSIVASRGVALAPEPAVVHSPAIPAPPVIRFDAGTRVWIALRSVLPLADGASGFRGVVLLPVTQSDAVLLGRNTEVSGTMTLRNGKRSVQILEFLSPGAHYTLRSASGEVDLRLLGAGEVVEFDAGRVLETWMVSVSTYEKLPGEPRPPE